MQNALITGITGQDGLYMASLLSDKGYHVIGAVRDKQAAKNTLLAHIPSNNIDLISWDMLDQHSMKDALTKYKPSEIYNFAAYSSGAGMFDRPVEVGQVNGLAVARTLEAIRAVDTNIRFCQASSSELFGEALESPQSETTSFQPRTPYGAAKLYAHSMIRIYRKRYGLFACSAILFNHESPRRGLGFVTRKITHTAAKIKLGLASELCLGSLEARRDWGFAGDTVNAMWRMLQHDRADDYVVSTGETHSVRDLCEIAFSYLDLDYRDYVREGETTYRSVESVQLVGNSSKVKTQLGWEKKMGFREMIIMMVDSDLKCLKNSNYSATPVKQV